MKKLPLVFAGCLLGLASAENLIADTWPVLSYLLSLTGLVLWIFFLILHLFNWEDTKQELTKPPSFIWDSHLSHGWDDFIDLCLSCLPCSSFGSARALVVFLSLGFGFDCYFYHQICLSRSEGQCDSKLSGALCGDSSSGLDLSSGRHY